MGNSERGDGIGLFPGWIEPLLDRIKRDPTTVVCPVIDVIDDNTFEYHYSKVRLLLIGR